MEEHFFSKIKEQLQEHSVPPPEKAWETIEVALNKQKSPSLLIWKRWLSVAAALILPISFVTLTLWLQPEKKTIYTQIPKTEKNYNLPQNIKQKTTESTTIATNNAKKQIAKHTTHQTITKTQKAEIIQKTTEENNLTNQNATPSIKKDVEQTSKNNFSKNNENLSSKPEENILLNSLLKEEKKEFADNKNSNIIIEVSPYTGISSFMPLTDANLITSEMNQFNSKNKTATSYGSNIIVQVSPKLKIRSGVGVINIKQDTYNIPLTTLAGNYAKNINMTSTSMLKVDLPQNGTFHYPSDELKNNTTIKETLSYELQFIEIPFEVEYKLLQSSKFGMASTSGLSALLRNKNNIYINGNEQFAESTNINKASFSANIGLKLNYNINQKLTLNIEPQMKYFMNTVTDNDNVKPYTIGVNAGFSWKLFNK